MPWIGWFRSIGLTFVLVAVLGGVAITTDDPSHAGVDRRWSPIAAADLTDPLVGAQWWRSALGLTTLVPPGPGRPVTIVDTGVDFTHPEFAGRTNLLALDIQEAESTNWLHGTAVASVVGASANGVGIVGIYPEARLASWDARGDGRYIDEGAIAAGILAAAERGPGVINISIATEAPSLVIQQAIAWAIRRGMLVVAPSARNGTATGVLSYPASFPHVLTVAATSRDNGPAAFSTPSAYVDLAAPGVDITVADASSGGWSTTDGPSYASALVAGAAAWVWTTRPDLDASQLFEVMRRSAADLAPSGPDAATGHGMLSVATALTYSPVPTSDPFEPNEDVDYVRRSGLYDTGIPPLTTKSKRRAVLSARIDRVEDPRDVYSVWLPARTTTAITLISEEATAARLLAGSITSVREGLGARLLASTNATAVTQRIVYRNRGRGVSAYLEIVPGRSISRTTYTLQLRSR
jgi:hypothetical protein